MGPGFWIFVSIATVLTLQSSKPLLNSKARCCDVSSLLPALSVERHYSLSFSYNGDYYLEGEATQPGYVGRLPLV